MFVNNHEIGFDYLQKKYSYIPFVTGLKFIADETY